MVLVCLTDAGDALREPACAVAHSLLDGGDAQTLAAVEDLRERVHGLVQAMVAGG